MTANNRANLERHLLTFMTTLITVIVIWVGKTTNETNTTMQVVEARLSGLSEKLATHSHTDIDKRLQELELRVELIEFQQNKNAGLTMLKLTLYRLISDNNGTHGVLFKNNQKICYMADPPWKNNKPNVSCIPPGTYNVTYLARSASGKYRDVYLLHDVPNRLAILIHAGNLTGDIGLGLKTHSHGCLLPGLRLGKLANQRAVLASRAALNKLHKATNRKPFLLEVIHHA